MKIRLNSVLATLMLLALPAFAAEPEMERTRQMHTHMQEMRDTLDALDETQDPAVRAALMEKHLGQMRAGLQMMEGATEHRGRHGGVEMSMEQRMEMMEQRMQHMHTMMGQMMEHTAESLEPAPASPAPEHQH